MANQTTVLLEKLIRVQSAPSNKAALEECLNLCLAELKEFTIERFEHNGYKSALIYNTPKRPKKFKIILNGHLDIIPGKEEQYKPKTENGRMYGVGAMDMKASVASHITVFKEIAKKLDYPLGLQLVTEEELGGFDGTKYQIDQGVRTDFAIVGETTQFTIENETKGVFWLKISCKGKAAHGAYPWKGENALEKMNHFLVELEKRFPSPKKKEWKTTVNLARIETPNLTFNKIPDYCEAWFDIRYIPQDSDSIVNSIKELLPKSFKLDIVLKEPAQFVEKDNEYIKILQQITKKVIKKNAPLMQAMGSSDARHFTRVKCDAVEFGPLGGGMGSDSEWIDIKSLEDYNQILKDFLMSLE